MKFNELKIKEKTYLLNGKITNKKIIKELILREDELIGILTPFEENKIKLNFKTLKELRKEGVLQ